jgi:hypothetical protein
MYKTCLPSELSKYMINKMMELNNEITVDDINDSEPCLFLKCNEAYIFENMGTHVGVGNLLLYPYTGPDWSVTQIDRYVFDTFLIPSDMEMPTRNSSRYLLISNDECHFLYASMCPMSKFDPIVKDNILQTINKFNEITINYGYKCAITIHPCPKNSPFDFNVNLFDELCL